MPSVSQPSELSSHVSSPPGAWPLPRFTSTCLPCLHRGGGDSTVCLSAPTPPLFTSLSSYTCSTTHKLFKGGGAPLIVQQSKSEMSILNEDAKAIDTPTPNPHPPLLVEAPLWLFRLLPAQVPLTRLVRPVPPSTKGRRAGSRGVALLKSEGLSEAAPVQTSVSLTKRGAEGNEGQVCVMVSSPTPPPLSEGYAALLASGGLKDSPSEDHKAKVWQD